MATPSRKYRAAQKRYAWRYLCRLVVILLVTWALIVLKPGELQLWVSRLTVLGLAGFIWLGILEPLLAPHRPDMLELRLSWKRRANALRAARHKRMRGAQSARGADGASSGPAAVAAVAPPPRQQEARFVTSRWAGWLLAGEVIVLLGLVANGFLHDRRIIAEARAERLAMAPSDPPIERLAPSDPQVLDSFLASNDETCTRLALRCTRDARRAGELSSLNGFGARPPGDCRIIPGQLVILPPGWPIRCVER